jgi:alpha-beta hydrolase superfamily lysophospholipase
LVEELSAGVSRLSTCLSGHGHPIVLLAHSAGGVIASFAAARINVPVGVTLPGVFIMTVASPLAGTMARISAADGTAEPRFVMDLGTAITSYPAAAFGVQVVHLRTSFPADPHMEVTKEGHLPNDPSVGVAGARQINLPVELSHDASLLYVARKIADGSWERWRMPAAQAPKETDSASTPLTK